MKAKNRFCRILCITAFDSARALTMPVRSPLSSVTPALSIATSVPVPMAMPTSAAASAGASLTPSPTMATTRPSRRSFSITALFCSGKTSASTSEMPRRLATASAVVRLSPVSITTRTPSADSAASAVGVVGLTGSAIAMTPASLPFTPRNMAVAPSPRRRSASAASAAVSIFSSAKNLALPSASRLPSTMPMTPLPAGASKPPTGANSILRSAAAATIAAAGGEAQHLRLVEAGQRDDRHYLRLAFRERAGLVDHQRVHFLHALERFRVLDQHAQLRAAADADHDRHRRGKAKRARAGDD